MLSKVNMIKEVNMEESKKSRPHTSCCGYHCVGSIKDLLLLIMAEQRQASPSAQNPAVFLVHPVEDRAISTGVVRRRVDW